jgi:hypothetical protein
MRVVFSDPEKPIDVVIPYHEKDSDVVELCVKGCFKNIKGIRNIYIVSRNITPHIEGVHFVEEDKLFSGRLNKNYIEDRWQKIGVENLRISGWLLQQFIKIGASYAITNLSNNYVVIDADVVFLRPVEFFRDDRSLMCYGKGGFEPDYLCCEKLLGQKVCRDYSFVTHHMPINKQLIIELLEDIEKRFEKRWYDAAIDCFADKNLRFSEYQLYGQFLFDKHKDKFRLRKLNYLEKYKLKYYPLMLLGIVDYIVFHSHRKPDVGHSINKYTKKYKWKYNVFLNYVRQKVANR